MIHILFKGKGTEFLGSPRSVLEFLLDKGWRIPRDGMVYDPIDKTIIPRILFILMCDYQADDKKGELDDR